jgi:hypothetical protein
MENTINEILANGTQATEQINSGIPNLNVKKQWIQPSFQIVSGNTVIQSGGPLAGVEGSGSSYYS